MPPCFLFCCYVLQFFQCPAQLVRARCSFHTATNSVQSGQHVIDVLPSYQLADTLQVAVTSSNKEHLLDNVVLISCHVNHLRARATRFVHNMLRLHNLIYYNRQQSYE